MALLARLAATNYYRDAFGERDQYRGDDLQAWVKPLEFGEAAPEEFVLTCTAAALEDATSISLATAAGKTVKIYKYDTLWFNQVDVMAVVLADATLTATASAVEVFPLMDAIPINAITRTMGLLPCLSFETGFIPQTTGTIAESRNRGQSLFSAKGVFGRSYTMSAEGTAIRNDPGLFAIDALSQNNGRLFFQSRRPPFDDYGIGFAARTGTVIVESSSPSSDQSGFSKVNYTLNGDGPNQIYLPSGMVLSKAKTLLPNSQALAYV